MSKPKFELWLSHFHQFILSLIYRRNMSTKIDNKEWVGIKIKDTKYPDDIPKEVKQEYFWNTNPLHDKKDKYIINYLNKAYQGRTMIAYKD